MPIPNPQQLLDDITVIARQLGVRALIGAGRTEYGAAPGELSDQVFLATSELNHDLVLPRCAAAVHHGGSGTTAAVARAGIPSVVVSVFLDQPFWGWRLSQLGLGVDLPFRRLSRTRLAQALTQALDSTYTTRASAYGAVLRAENGPEQAADVIERWAPDDQ
ncbi:glycosyltransferase [Kribbella sp. NPDC002412]